MEKMIHTVLGEILPTAMGFTQCHEHLLLSKGKSYEVNPMLYIDSWEKSIQETLEYRDAGGCAIVEAQPGGCNRDSEGLEEIGKRTEVSIIASTGFHKMQFYPEKHWIHTINEKTLADLFVSELTEGMYTKLDQELLSEQQEAKAGIVKTALDSCNLEGRYQTLFAAAARAQIQTGAPMMVHVEKGSDPNCLLTFLHQYGVDLEKVYFCHMDRACDNQEEWKRVLDTGAMLEFDTIGRWKYHSDEEEVTRIKRILDQGYEKQLLVSLDTTRERLKTYHPEGVGLTYILKVFLPMLKEAGVTVKQIEAITVENPRKILAW